MRGSRRTCVVVLNMQRMIGQRQAELVPLARICIHKVGQELCCQVECPCTACLKVHWHLWRRGLPRAFSSNASFRRQEPSVLRARVTHLLPAHNRFAPMSSFAQGYFFCFQNGSAWK